MTIFRDTIQTMTATFVEGLLAVIREQSLGDLVGEGTAATRQVTQRVKTNGVTRHSNGALATAEAKTKAAKASGGRLARRSAEEIQALIGKVVALLKTSKDGMRAEQIRDALGMQPKEMPRVLADGVSSKALVVLHGQKRSTTYGVRGAGKAKAPKAKAASKAKAPKAKPKTKVKAATKKVARVGRALKRGAKRKAATKKGPTRKAARKAPRKAAKKASGKAPGASAATLNGQPITRLASPSTPAEATGAG